MCAATAVGRLEAASWKQTCPCPARSRTVDVPVATGSPAGLSASPVSETFIALPPLVAVSTVPGHPPAGTGKMSAARSGVEERRLTYGFVLDVVRLQTVRFASFWAAAAPAPATASASAVTTIQSFFMPTPPKVDVASRYVTRAGSDSAPS